MLRRAFGTLGARHSVFRTVGVPAAALKISLAPSQTAQARGGVVLAAEDPNLDVSKGVIEGPTQLLLGLTGNPVVIAAKREKWVLDDKYVVASTESDDQTVVAAPGGVVRVDVPVDGEFVAEKDKVVGYTGSPGTIVFRESRFDITRAWLGWTSQRLASWFLYAANGFRLTVVQVGRGFEWIVQKFKKQDLSVPKEVPVPKAPNKTVEEVKKSWAKVVPHISAANAYTRAKLFTWTHPPKLRFSGPCSVLIKS